MEASSHLPFPGFFELLRNLRSAMRTGPDLDGLFVKLGCKCRFGNDGVIRPWCAAPNFGAKQTKHGCSHRFGNDGVSRQMARSAIA